VAWLSVVSCAAVCGEVAPPDSGAGNIVDLEKRIKALERCNVPFGALQRIELKLETTWVVQGTSGLDDLTPDKDTVESTGRVDLSMASEIEKLGAVCVKFKAVEGEGVDAGIDDGPGTFWRFNKNGKDAPRLYLDRLTLTMPVVPDDVLTVQIGKVKLPDWFDTNKVANCEKTQFLATGFVNSAAIEFPGNTTGFAVSARPPGTKAVSLRLGCADANADMHDVFDDIFGIVELDLTCGEKRPQNLRLIGWVNDAHHEMIADPARNRESGWGLGVSADHAVAEHLKLFFRYGWENSEVYEVDRAWSAGFEIPGGLLGGAKGAFGAAFGAAMLSDDEEDALRAGGTDPADERHVEAYWRLEPRSRLAVTFDVQWGDNLGGDDAVGGVWAFGTRLRVVF